MAALRRRATTEIAAENRAEEERQYKALYGDLLPAVDLLRKRGFVVTKEGDKFRVGNKLMMRAEVRSMAEREGGLAGISFARRPAETASGLKVGHVESVKPKKTPAARVVARPAAPRPAAAASKAKAAEHSAELGKRPRVVWLDLGLLKIDRTYQREVGELGRRHIGRLLKTFNWNCYQPIIVTENPDGTFAVIDGQHRLEAAKQHPLVDSLPCYVIDAPNVAAQAAVFTAVNSARLGLTSQQKFFAAIAAKEPQAMALMAICEKFGITIPRGNPPGVLPPMTLVAATVCQKLIARHGDGPVREALGLLAAAHPGRAIYRSHFIAALTVIAAEKGYSRDRTRAVIASFDLADLHAQTVSSAAGGGRHRTTATTKIIRSAMAALAGKP